ncbi:MAG: hypothetical protein ACOC3V_01935 [bacterium]
MAKYARIKNNDKKSIFKINGCDSCPFMKFTINDSVAKCKLFESKNKSDVVDIYVINHCNDGIIYDKINIPKWCELPNNETDVFNSSIIYMPFLNSVLVQLISEDELNYNVNEPIIDIEYYKNISDKRIIDYLLQFVDKTSNKWSNYYDELDITNDDNLLPKIQVCSNCGEHSECVKRDNKYGMCNECWELHKNSENILKKAFINNFRLKRNKSINNKYFKLIDIKI